MFTHLRFGQGAYYYTEYVSGKWLIFKMPISKAIPEAVVGEYDSFTEAQNALGKLCV